MSILESGSSAKKVKSNDDADADADDEAEAEAELLAEDKASAEWDEEMVPVPVDATSLTDLMEMGFSDVRARKGEWRY
jgi:hypothetical protein